MADGFVKEPAIATKQNFRLDDYKDRPDALELVKLKDGICLHEDTKAELKVYAEQSGKPFVKPFMLVIARDVAHAERIVETIRRDDFFNGDYQDKVITVHSTLSGEEKEETVSALLSVESPDNKTEIVVHVNMLKEGWDVTNLYTVVPLRKADSRTLVEQSIGRGLRLPYGHRTGVKAVDRLAIVAHDRFQEIIDEANKPGSSINFKLQTIVIGVDVGVERKVTRIVAPRLADELAGPAFATDAERKVAQATFEIVRGYERDPKRVPTVAALKAPEVRSEIVARVTATVAHRQLEFAAIGGAPDVEAIVERVLDLTARDWIGIPRILVVPSGEVTTGFHDFDLDIAIRPQPREENIVLHELRTGERTVLEDREGPETGGRLEDDIVGRLIDFDDICYDDQADLLYKLAGQVVAHIRSYQSDEAKVFQISRQNLGTFVDLIYAQMQKHRWTHATRYDVSASRGFEALKPVPFSETVGQPVRDFRELPTPLHDIPKMLFSGFSRCLYSVQKFDSDPERRFAALLEDEKQDLKWFKPAREQFRIYYRGDQTYEPDFVVETATHKYLCEPKRASDMDDEIVRAKARAAVEWCRHATDHELAHGGKPWSYLLIPHDAIAASATLEGLAASYQQSS